MSESVFLDSGVFIAFMNQRDRWHAQAVSLFNGPQPQWRTSVLVIAETYSWFLHRMGEEAARRFRLLTANLPDLRVFEATLAHDAEVGKMLERLRGTKLTYVDASSLCFMEQHGIRHVWSTDHHLGIAGAKVVPRVQG